MLKSLGDLDFSVVCDVSMHIAGSMEFGWELTQIHALFFLVWFAWGRGGLKSLGYLELFLVCDVSNHILALVEDGS